MLLRMSKSIMLNWTVFLPTVLIIFREMLTYHKTEMALKMSFKDEFIRDCRRNCY